jgi:iron-sulfur cluster repair protein YtfE (RIC family)
MAVDATEMMLVHRAFRREFANIPGLIAGVPSGDTKRAKIVAGHLEFMIDGLHHHHAAEDELAWPVLIARLPDRRDEIARMAEQHEDIAAAIRRVQSAMAEWTNTVDGPTSQRLQISVAELARLLIEHLDEEERVAVPVIEEHMTQAEWKAATDRGASFLSSRPVMGIVLGGLLLDYADPDERRLFLAGVPAAQRILLKLLSGRMATSYRRKLYGAS